MIAPSHPSAIVSIGFAAFIAWRVYRKVRRMVARQRLKPVRAWLTLIFFPLLLALLVLTAWAAPMNLAALLGGGVLGGALGVYGLRLTRFETTPSGLFYTPNVHLGIALSVLFIGRIAYRFIEMAVSGLPTGSATPHDFARNPLTLAIFATLAVYYCAYAAGLLAWRRRENRTALGAPVAPVVSMADVAPIAAQPANPSDAA